MRLDKMLSECGVASRSEVARACRKGLVLVNGAPAAKPDLQVDETTATVTYCGAPVRYPGERDVRVRKENRENGIPVNDEVWALIQNL